MGTAFMKSLLCLLGDLDRHISEVSSDTVSLQIIYSFNSLINLTATEISKNRVSGLLRGIGSCSMKIAARLFHHLNLQGGGDSNIVGTSSHCTPDQARGGKIVVHTCRRRQGRTSWWGSERGPPQDPWGRSPGEAHQLQQWCARQTPQSRSAPWGQTSKDASDLN